MVCVNKSRFNRWLKEKQCGLSSNPDVSSVLYKSPGDLSQGKNPWDKSATEMDVEDDNLNALYQYLLAQFHIGLFYITHF